MSARLSLERLIEYVEQITQVGTNSPTTTQSVELPGSIEQIDKVSYDILDFGLSSSVNNLPPNIKSMFEPYLNHVKRHGVINKNEEFNYSLYFSILMCISNKFETFEFNDQIIMINVFQEQLLKSLNTLFDNNHYTKLGWRKNDLRNSIQKCEFNKMILQYISDFLYVNIFLVNISDDKLYLTYPEECFNIYKGNIFLSYHNNTFEPLSINDNRVVTHNDLIFKKLINVHKKSLNIIALNLKSSEDKVFDIKSEDLTIYLKEEQQQQVTPTLPIPDTPPVISSDVTPELDNIVEKQNNFSEVLVEEEIKVNNKMKIGEIQEIAKKYNIELTSGKLANGKLKYKTKDALIQEIINISK